TFVAGTNDEFNISADQLRVGPLRNNGGPTLTHALLCGSPAIDAGDNTDAPPTDQRGFPRIVNGIIDIGAFEYSNTPPSITCASTNTLQCTPPSGEVATISANVSDANGDSLVVIWIVDGAVYQTNVVAGGDTSTNATVTLTAPFTVGSHQVTIMVSDPSACVASCTTTVLVIARGDLYPIALHISTLNGATVGSILTDIYNGIQPGNFGWLTWAGSPS